MLRSGQAVLPRLVEVGAAPLRLGMEAVTLQGWRGRIAELDQARGRAVLEANGLRVDVPIEELIGIEKGAPRPPGVRPRPGDVPRTGRRGEFGEEPRTAKLRPPATTSTTPRRMAIPSTLDVRGARVDEATQLLDQFIDQAATAGAGRVTIVHGHGSGALRDAVRDLLSGHPLVSEWRPGERGEGGDGATVVTL